MEQVVILTLIGKEAMKSAGHLLCQILHPGFQKQPQNPGDSFSWGRFVGLGQLNSIQLLLTQQVHLGKVVKGAL